MIVGILAVLLFALCVGAILAKRFGDRYTTSPPPARTLHQGQLKPDCNVLSVVIPAYNEEERLSPTLKDVVAFCEVHIKDSKSTFQDYEILLVDDCSTDKTRQIAQDFITANPTVKMSVIGVKPNHGKGYAVRTGFLAASGDFVLMADADNATQFSDVAKIIAEMEKSKFDIGIGSRAHLEKEAIASRTLGRNILMWGFHMVVAVAYFVATLGNLCYLKDTQCGFKVFRRFACLPVFLNSRLERWAFDVELLILAKRIGLTVVEVSVRWEEIPGSKVRLSGMVQMGLECLLMCFTYPLGFWPIRRRGKKRYEIGDADAQRATSASTTPKSPVRQRSSRKED